VREQEGNPKTPPLLIFPHHMYSLDDIGGKHCLMSDIHEAKTSSMAVHMVVHMFLWHVVLCQTKLFKFKFKI